MASKPKNLISLDPRDTGVEQPRSIARRPASLDGKVLGLLSNNKPNSEDLLRMLADLVKQEYSIVGVVEANKGTHRVLAPSHMIDDLLSRCDAVITATAE